MSQNAPVSIANCRTEDQANSLQQNQHTCSSCSSRTFSTYRGLCQHNRHCTKAFKTVSISSSQSVTISERADVADVFSPVTSFVWGERNRTLLTADLNKAYEKMVFWRKNLFILPIGNAGKKCIKEVTRLLNLWTQNTPLRSISLETIHTMPALLSQNPSKTSKSGEHLDALERRPQLWERGEI